MDVFLHWIESSLRQATWGWDVLLLFGFSYLLGVTHTFGPGHGKSLLLGVLVADSKRIGHALKMAFVIGITHMTDVVLLSLLSIFITASLSLHDFSAYVGRVSGTAILILGVYRIVSSFWFTIESEDHDPSSRDSEHDHRHERERENLLTAFFYSLAPCPAAWVLFMACLGLGKPLLGFVLLLGFTGGLLTAISGIAVGIVYSFQQLDSFLPEGSRRGLSLLSGVIIAVLGVWLLIGAGHAH
jgi:nickel/cobalt exporter